MRAGMFVATMLASVLAQAGDGLDPAMNGDYRCDGGVTFSAKVKIAPDVKSEVVFSPVGASTTGSTENGSGARMRDSISGTRYYGVHVRHEGRKYKLYPVDGEANVYTDNNGKFRWVLVDGSAPYASLIVSPDDKTVNNCRQAAAAEKQ